MRSALAGSLFGTFLSVAALVSVCGANGCSSSDQGLTSSSSSSSGGNVCPNDLPACSSPPPSYGATVAKIIDTNCEPCHAAGGVADGRLLTQYDTLFALRQDVLDQIHSCKMPPVGSPAVSMADRNTLLSWLECGAPNN